MYGAMEESTPAEAPALAAAEIKAVRELLSTSSSIGGSDVDATIANIASSGAGGCWAQFGSEPTPQSDSDYKSCVLASMPPGS